MLMFLLGAWVGFFLGVVTIAMLAMGREEREVRMPFIAQRGQHLPGPVAGLASEAADALEGTPARALSV